MTNPSYQTISGTEKDALMLAYTTFMGNLNGGNAIGLLSADGPDTYVYWYKIDFLAYEAMVIHEGVTITEWKLRFGYVGSDSCPFKVILWGENGGNVVTDYYLLEQYGTTKKLFQNPPVVGQSIVPEAEAVAWIERYSAIVESGMFSVGHLQSFGQLLNGYTYLHHDFQDVMKIVELPGMEYQKKAVYIPNVLHTQPSPPVTDQFGQMLVMEFEDREKGSAGPWTTKYTQFYDFSAPCPPTC